jgi:hypothetical protein
MTERPQLSEIEESERLVRPEDVGLERYRGRQGQLPDGIVCDFWMEGPELVVSAQTPTSEVGLLKVRDGKISDVRVEQTWRRQGIATFMKAAGELHLGHSIDHSTDISDEALQWAIATEPGARHQRWYRANEERIDQMGW